MQLYHSQGSRRPSISSFLFLVVLGAALYATAALAQNSGIFIYPARGQNQAQQDRDRNECQSWAFQQTGFDPNRPSQPAMSAAPTPNVNAYQQPRGHILRGAGRGAALGAVGGAIAGDAGTGAAAGAAMGGLAGGFRRRDARRELRSQQQYSQQQYSQQQQSGLQNQQSTYYRAMAACLQGRGYTVN